jgi:hypothetical protein
LANTDERGLPPGPWVLVVGMHRSGTSALTGALAHLGLAVPAGGDLVVGRYDNPVHYESQALTDLDDAVLGALGGSWSAPPELDPGWERAAVAARFASGAAHAARQAYPVDGPVVWKDPRLCLLLPWWRSLLPAPVATVLVWRDPVAVARSLRFRQGFTLSLGLALWERYNRAALGALGGHPGYVLSYEDLLVDPHHVLEALARWLGTASSVPLRAGDDTLSAAVASVSSDSARPARAEERGEDIEETVELLGALAGPHDRLPETPGRESARWMADAIAQRREYEALYARYMRYIRWRRRIPLVGRSLRRPGRGAVTPQGNEP